MALDDHPQVRDLLDGLRARLQAILGDELVGIYLYGSLVTGDYDDDISDVDLLVATADMIDEVQFAALDAMQADVVAHEPRWDDRLEIAYISRYALRTFKTQPSQIAIVSPGEPFHFKTADADWLLNWYIVRETGVTLHGPSPETIIAPISKAEFIEAVKRQVWAWQRWIPDDGSRPFQAYAILTMCRALYACTHGEQVSKLQAAAWAQAELPEWSVTIANAIAWRRHWREAVADPAATLAETRRFVQFVVDRIGA